jgi:RNA polymerase subunit RPABC4/transcription elongation factor Spt4
VYGNITSNFSGFVALMAPKSSWVAKWCTVENNIPGCYAVSVEKLYESEEEDQEED